MITGQGMILQVTVNVENRDNNPVKWAGIYRLLPGSDLLPGLVFFVWPFVKQLQPFPDWDYRPFFNRNASLHC